MARDATPALCHGHRALLRPERLHVRSEGWSSLAARNESPPHSSTGCTLRCDAHVAICLGRYLVARRWSSATYGMWSSDAVESSHEVLRSRIPSPTGGDYGRCGAFTEEATSRSMISWCICSPLGIGIVDRGPIGRNSMRMLHSFLENERGLQASRMTPWCTRGPTGTGSTSHA